MIHLSELQRSNAAYDATCRQPCQDLSSMMFPTYETACLRRPLVFAFRRSSGIQRLRRRDRNTRLGSAPPLLDYSRRLAFSVLSSRGPLAHPQVTLTESSNPDVKEKVNISPMSNC